jgi:hypothetical protein
VLADTGYLGIHKIHSNSKIPLKSSKYKKLSADEKKQNKALSSRRILVENIIGCVKKFRILIGVYRNRRRRFSLRFNLSCAIHNFELEN